VRRPGSMAAWRVRSQTGKRLHSDCNQTTQYSPLGEVVGQDVAAGGPALLHPLGLQSGDPTIIEPSLVPSRSQGPPEAPFGSVVGSLGILYWWSGGITSRWRVPPPACPELRT
jgi:hypothetical protein